MGIDTHNETGVVFNIQRYSIHDGPGIRTIVFLKGCPLSCPWCSNPEGMGFAPELSHTAQLCRKCGQCIEVCPTGALTREKDGSIAVDRARCSLCGACTRECGTGALKIFGERMPVGDILREVNKDAVFYKRSGGGMTVSGGDPLANPKFLSALLRQAKEQYGLNVTLETSLYADTESVRAIIPYVDHVYADIKLFDNTRHERVIGVPNGRILDNIRLLAGELPKDKSLVLRFPLIPSINDDEENITATAAFIKSLGREVRLEVLPYHEFGRGKYTALGREYPLTERGIPAPDKEHVARIERMFTDAGIGIIKT